VIELGVELKRVLKDFVNVPEGHRLSLWSFHEDI
jgi:hypothetical protein